VTGRAGCLQILVVAAGLCVPLGAHAQSSTPEPAPVDTPAPDDGIIYGFVIDRDTRARIADVEIVLTATGLPARTTRTKASGGYRFAELPAATYTVLARAGKASFAKTFELATNGRQRLSFLMDPLVDEHRAVVVRPGDPDDTISTPMCLGHGCRKWYREWARVLRRQARQEARKARRAARRDDG